MSTKYPSEELSRNISELLKDIPRLRVTPFHCPFRPSSSARTTAAIDDATNRTARVSKPLYLHVTVVTPRCLHHPRRYGRK